MTDRDRGLKGAGLAEALCVWMANARPTDLQCAVQALMASDLLLEAEGPPADRLRDELSSVTSMLEDRLRERRAARAEWDRAIPWGAS